MSWANERLVDDGTARSRSSSTASSSSSSEGIGVAAGDLSRLSGFPQLSHFNFGFPDGEPSPASPTAYDRRQPFYPPSSSPSSYQPLAVESPSTSTPHPQLPIMSREVAPPPLSPLQPPLQPPPQTSPRRQQHQYSVAEAAIPEHFDDGEAPPPYTKYAEQQQQQQRQQTRPSQPAPAHTRSARSGGGRVFPAGHGISTLTLDDLSSDRQKREAMEAARRRHESRQRRNGMRGGFCGRRQRKKHRRCCFVAAGLVAIAVVAIVIGTAVGVTKMKAGARRAGRGSRSSTEAGAEADAADWGGLPPIPLGDVLVRPSGAASRLATCVAVPLQWSCSLPPDTRFPVTTAINDGLRVPEFRFTIRRRPRAPGGPESEWKPVPGSVPNATDYASVAAVDGTADGGEETALDISLATVASSSAGTTAPGADLQEPAAGGIMVRPESHMLPPVLRNQPLRLFNRGQDNEHYGFHVYFDKTVQFASNSSSSSSGGGGSGLSPGRDTGGASAAESRYRIRWANTRFKVAIFTSKPGGKGSHRQVHTDGAAEVDYPVDIWADRADGLQERDGQVIMALPLDKDGVPGRPEGIVEKLGVGTDKRGCSCHWSNFVEV